MSRRSSGGRSARREERTSQQLEFSKFIERNIPNFELLNDEGLEIAAGMYLYHVQPSLSDKTLNQYEHVGKFAVIK